ncbi:MAG: TlpA disulfide reductase family protein [Candidatus Pseudobacter hemicellulosilyticus]|uniref:TlpA disulfide reductase family protein n=1 Tax=Candidatus Pseudobacter hemicellulosilyticus TaxID=3121375 RepID=A0AAJ5WRE7_9BACT|nr:MAG: TlpA disulfide reductase family protein [Pseudobacter sp.]
MKKTILLAAATLSGMVLSAQQKDKWPFTLEGKIDDVGEPAKVILSYSYDGKRVQDTTELAKGSFAFKGTVNKPGTGVIYLVKSSDNPRMGLAFGYGGEIVGRDGVQFYLDEGKIRFKGKDLKTASIKGSAAQQDYAGLVAKKKPVNDQLKAINEAMAPYSKDKQSAEYKALMDSLQSVMKLTRPIDAAFIKTHPKSWVSYNLITQRSIINDPQAVQEQYNALDATLKGTADARAFEDRLAAAFKTAVGAVAPDFVQDDTEGKELKLSSLRGKYVLIDFWASWCGPCRAENPNVVKAYEKYKDKNFEILAVSLDKTKDPWLKAIKDDGLPWLHVSDLKGWENEVAKQYYVRAVPQNFLLDPNGVIIAANLRGKELEEKLAAVLH